MMGFEQVLNNPSLIGMASQLMADPNIQNAIEQVMSGLVASDGTGGDQAGHGSINDFLQAGQQVVFFFFVIIAFFGIKFPDSFY